MDNLDGIDVTIMPDGAVLDDTGTLIGENVGASVLSAGSIFADRYKIISEGKAGGMGVVYKCLDMKLGDETTALKIIHPRLLHSEEALKRFHQEVTISRKLSHDGIVRVHDIGSYGGLEYFTMEWIEGVSLRDVIAERKKKRQPFSLEETSKIIHALSDALQHAHRYTIHRDIKPENIMVEGGDLSKLKLMDFGIAKMLSASQLATTSMQMGTPYYMAPEQKLDTGHVEKQADIYSVGVILFELLTLENTIGPELPSDLNSKLPKEIDEVFRKAVALRPENRYGDIGELAAALLKIVTAEKGRIQQREEEALLKKKAELAEQKKREAAEAERRKQEEERKEQEQKEQEEQERERLEAEAQAKRQEQEAARRKLEQEESERQWEDGKKRRNENTGLKMFVVVAVVVCLVFAYAIFQSRQAKVQQPTVSAFTPKTNAAKGIYWEGSFTAYDDGTVLDTRTNLMWAAKDNGSNINWQNAENYCKNYRGGGYTDWRLPTLDELASLYNKSKSRPGSVSRWNIHMATELIRITGYGYWSPETRGSEAAYFGFYDGLRYWTRQSHSGGTRVLPVRSAK